MLAQGILMDCWQSQPFYGDVIQRNISRARGCESMGFSDGWPWWQWCCGRWHSNQRPWLRMFRMHLEVIAKLVSDLSDRFGADVADVPDLFF